MPYQSSTHCFATVKRGPIELSATIANRQTKQGYLDLARAYEQLANGEESVKAGGCCLE